jgi:hypothetical protein
VLRDGRGTNKSAMFSICVGKRLMSGQRHTQTTYRVHGMKVTTPPLQLVPTITQSGNAALEATKKSDRNDLGLILISEWVDQIKVPRKVQRCQRILERLEYPLCACWDGKWFTIGLRNNAHQNTPMIVGQEQ